jgi:hypothetical protein
MTYDAFVSYSHAADGRLAPGLQSALQQFAKPWYRLRALRLFRDKTTLAATPHLWPTIEGALRDSRYFILLASPEAAASQWVQREVDWWLQNRSADTLLIVLTDGFVAWDNGTGDFDWARTNALPHNLHERFASEPLYVDLRWARTVDNLSLRHTQFRAAILDIAAVLHGKPKDEVDGADVREHRRTIRLAWSAFGLLVALTGISVATTWVAVQQRRIAEQRLRVAVSRDLAAASKESARANSQLSALFALRAVRETYPIDKTVTVEAYSALVQAETFVRGANLAQPWNSMSGKTILDPAGTRLAVVDRDDQNPLSHSSEAAAPDIDVYPLQGAHGVGKLESPARLREPGTTVLQMTFSPDGKHLATANADKTVRVWDVESEREVGTLQHDGAVLSVAYSPDGRWLASGGDDGKVRVWDTATATLSASLDGHKGGIVSLAFSQDGRLLASGGEDKRVKIWNPVTGHYVRVFAGRRGIERVAFGPLGLLATASGAGARIRSVRSGEEIAAVSGHNGYITGVAFRPGGSAVATVGLDGVAKLWELPSAKLLLDIDMGPEERASGVTFSKDGAALAVTYYIPSDRVTVRVFDLDLATLLQLDEQEGIARALTADECQRYLHTSECPR